MTTAAIYTRVSSVEQTEGTSLSTQRTTCEARARAEGWEFVHFTDEGISGSRADRPGWLALIAACDEGEVDVVIVASLDRFSRSTADAVGTIRRLHTQGIQFVSLKESIDLTTSAGKLQLTMLAGMAEFERDRITERIVSGQRAKASQGVWPSGFVPYGYRLEGKGRDATPVPDVSERAIITLAVDAMLNDGMTTGQVASLLNGMGHRGRKGGAWTHQTVRRTLEKESLMGRVWWGQPARPHGKHKTKLTKKGTPMHGEPIAIDLPDPPLTVERWEALQRVLEARGYGRKRDAAPYPNSGAATVCGGHLGGVTRRDRGLRQYRCSNSKWSADPGHVKCSCARINADWLDSVVWGAVVDMLTDPQRLMKMASDYLGLRAETAQPEAEALGALEAQIARLEKARVDQAVEALKAGVPADVMAAAVAQIDTELVALRQRRDGVLSWRASQRAEQQRASDFAMLAAQARDRLPTMPLEQQGEVLRLLRVSVTLRGPSRTPGVIVRGVVPGGGPLFPESGAGDPEGPYTPQGAPRVTIPFEVQVA